MADFPALPLWTDAYLGDCHHLSDANHGRYVRLLMLMWRSPQCRIPNDDVWLAYKLERSVEDIQKEIRPIISEFCSSTGNWITQKRLKREWEYVRRYSKNQSARAKRRWDKEKGNASALQTPHSERNAPTPTPTPTRKVSEEKESFNGQTAGGNGSGEEERKWGAGTVTLKDPVDRIARFQMSLTPVLGPHAWTIMDHAMRPSHPEHHGALEKCKDAAHKLKKGWPLQWPSLEG